MTAHAWRDKGPDTVCYDEADTVPSYIASACKLRLESRAAGPLTAVHEFNCIDKADEPETVKSEHSRVRSDSQTIPRVDSIMLTDRPYASCQRPTAICRLGTGQMQKEHAR